MQDVGRRRLELQDEAASMRSVLQDIKDLVADDDPDAAPEAPAAVPLFTFSPIGAVASTPTAKAPAFVFT